MTGSGLPRIVSLVLLSIVLMGGFSAARAAGLAAADLYFVSVGSSHYAEPASPDIRGLADIPGANKSAREVGTRLSTGGAKFGIVLRSDPGRYVGTDDIYSAVAKVAEALARDRPKNPLLFVYLAGHGISEGVAWNHYWLPGSFTYRGEGRDLAQNDLSGDAVHAATLVAQLNGLGVPYILLIDACYTGTPASFESPVLSSSTSENLGAIANAVRAFNQFRQASPVIFSSPPGKSQPTVEDPSQSGPQPVAPLARRIMLLADARAHTGFTVADFLKALTSVTHDPKTEPAVTFAQPSHWWARPLVRPRGAAGRLETLTGTATGPRACCSAPDAPESQASAARGSVILDGRPGEYVTGGSRIEVKSPPGTITVKGQGGGVSISAADRDPGWTVSLAAADGARLSPRRYRGAERFGFQSAGRPGLAVTGPSTACNQVEGEFAVQTVHYDSQGQLDQLDATFRQVCDDVPVPLTGRVALRRP